MTYPNAYNGVKKIHTAQVLNLISSILGFVVAILSVLSISSIAASNENAFTFALIALIVGLIAAVFSVIAYILQIVGLKKAGNDDSAFYTAFVFAIIGLVLIVLSAIFSVLKVANGFGDDIASIFTEFASVIICIFVTIGVRNLASQLGQNAMVDKAKRVAILQAVIIVLVIIANIISIFTGNTAVMVSGIIGLVAAVLTVVFAFVYLAFLGKAKKMLKEN